MSERHVPYLPTLVEKAGQASAELSAEQRAARFAAWQSITALLETVRGHLAGHALKGLENLATSTKPYRAAQVRRARHWDPLPLPPRAQTEHDPTTLGDPVLVIDSEARLMVARRNGLGDVADRPVTEADVLAEDASAVAEAVIWALRRHLLDVGAAKERYRVLKRLAQRLERALGEH
jgi:hypothetical protein